MPGLEQRRILVVEDEFYLAMDVAEALKRGGAEVIGPFPDSEAALAALHRERPDCAVVDVNLGEGPAFELADHLLGRGVNFLFFTGYDRAMIPSRFDDVARLEKPVDDQRLILAVQTICEARSGSSDIKKVNVIDKL